MPDRLVLALYLASFAVGGLIIRQVALWLGFKKAKKNPHFKWLLGLTLITVFTIFAQYELTVGRFSQQGNSLAQLGRVELVWFLLFMVLTLGWLIQVVVIPLVKFLVALIFSW